MNCAVCERDRFDSSMSVPESMFRTGLAFRYDRCASCHSWTKVDDGDAQTNHYPDGYYSFAVSPQETFSHPLARVVATALARSALSGAGATVRLAARWGPQRQLRSLATILASVSMARDGRRLENVIDVGTGSGVVPFVLSLPASIDAVGIDPFAPTETRHDRFELRTGTLADIGGAWDLIMFHHSLEHVPDPRTLLVTARDMLSPGGRIIVRVPTCDSWAFDFYGASWFQLDAPRHEFLPSRDGLRQLVESCGLKIERWYDDSTDVQFWMSDYVAQGLSTMDPATDLRTFRRPSASRVALFDMKRRARSLNTRLAGDQTCLILSAV